MRPNHLYYYDGDPTEAVFKFMQDNGIGARTDGYETGLLGFEDHSIENKEDMRKDPRSNIGRAELEETASKIITDRYRGNPQS